MICKFRLSNLAVCFVQQPPVDWRSPGNLNSAWATALRATGYDSRDEFSAAFKFIHEPSGVAGVGYLASEDNSGAHDSHYGGLDQSGHAVSSAGGKLDSLEALSHVYLEYGIDWPLQLVITPEHMRDYNRIFRFLLKLKRVSAELKALWVAFKTRNQAVSFH